MNKSSSLGIMVWYVSWLKPFHHIIKPKSFRNIDFDKLLTLDGGILYKTTNWILKEIEKVQSIHK